MQRFARTGGLGLVLLGWLGSAPAFCQPPSTGLTSPPPNVSTDQPGANAEGGSFLGDVLRDYRHFISGENLAWLAVGGVGSLALHQADEAIRDETQEGTSGFATAEKGGAVYGNLAFQVPLALGWWAVGHATGSRRGADTGRDLLRAQISALSWTYAFKYTADRTRPNGDPRSFPSGHASASFATAMVLQRHYGWKVGVPGFAAAAYTAASRVTENKHWASDVAFGSALGLVCGRTVTLHVRSSQLVLAPEAVPRGVAIMVTARQ